jgi:hypothetical protein
MMNENRMAAVIETILAEGNTVVGRGGAETVEVLGATVAILPGTMPLRPGFSQRLAWVDAFQAFAGHFDQKQMEKALGHPMRIPYKKASAWGPYMPDWILAELWEQLEKNPESRRAVLHLGHGKLGEQEKPCNTTIQFLIRGGKLHIFPVMRSWDMGVGAFYDNIVFQLMQKVLAELLGLECGHVSVYAVSAHVYTSDIEDGRFGDLTYGEYISEGNGKFDTYLLPELPDLRAQATLKWDLHPDLKTLLKSNAEQVKDGQLSHKGAIWEIQRLFRQLVDVFVVTSDNYPVMVEVKNE